MKRPILVAVMIFGLAAPVSARDHQEDPLLTPESAVPDWDEEALRMPPHGLALAYLLNFENTRWLEQSYDGFKVIIKVTKNFSLRIATFYPDGTTQTIVLKTIEEIDQFLPETRLLLTTYEKAIMHRGFKQLAMIYDATVSPGCSDRWFASGKVAVKQKDFLFELSQAGKAVSGAVVEDTVTVKLFGGDEPALLGRYGKSIELRYAQSKCRINLLAYLTTLEATPHKLVLLLHWGSEPATREEFEEVKRLGAEHCKKFDKAAGQPHLSLNLGSPSGVATIPCVDNK